MTWLPWARGVVQEAQAPFIFGSAPAARSGGYWYDDVVAQAHAAVKRIEQLANTAV